jgi:hypothetical protein
MKLVKNKKHNITYHKETRLVFEADVVYAFFDGTNVLPLDDEAIELAKTNGFKYRVDNMSDDAEEEESKEETVVEESSKVEEPVVEEPVVEEPVVEEPVVEEPVVEEPVVEEGKDDCVSKKLFVEDVSSGNEYEVVTPATYLTDLLTEQSKRLTEYFDSIQVRHTTELNDALFKCSELKKQVDTLQKELDGEKSKLRRLLDFTTSL